LRASFSVPGKLYAVRGNDLWRWSGTTARRLTRDLEVADPAVSKDGTQLAFIRRGRSFSDLWIADSDGQNARPLTSERNAWTFRPAWSPDGPALALVSDRFPKRGDVREPPTIWLYQLDAGRFVRLAQASSLAGGDSDPTWSPAGDALLYTSFLYEPREGGAPVLSARLTYCQPGRRCDLFASPPGERFLQPAWSPDGKWVAFVRGTPDGADLYVMPAPARQDILERPPFPTERAVRLITGMVAQPAWSPDGAYLAYLAQAPAGGFDLMVAPVLQDPGIRAGTPVALTSRAGLRAESRLAWGP
jgi:Tol biopolymer transport system component